MKRFVIALLAFVAAVVVVDLVVLLMVSPYVVRVGITNEASEPIDAIPVGRFNGAWLVGRPPLYRAQFIIPIPRGGEPYELASRDTSSFLYDFDDVNLCWLLVRGASKTWKVVPSRLADQPGCALAPDAVGPCCTALSTDDVFHVKPLDELQNAPPWLACVADESC